MMTYKMSSQTPGKTPGEIKVLAIDPGFGRLGYAVIEKNNLRQNIVSAGCVETSPKLPYKDRFAKIAKEVGQLIEDYSPQVLAIEKIFLAKNQKTAFQVAEIRGLVIYLAMSRDVEIFEFTPLEVKLAVCGYGKADKTQVSKMVKMLTKMGTLPKIDDAVDAIAIGLTFLAKEGLSKFNPA